MQMKSNATSPHAAWYDADSGFESTHAIEKDRLRPTRASRYQPRVGELADACLDLAAEHLAKRAAEHRAVLCGTH